MSKGNLWGVAGKGGVVLGVTLAIVVVLAAVPSRRGPGSQNGHLPQAAWPDSSMVSMDQETGPHAGHPTDGQTDDHHMPGMDHDNKQNEVAAVASMTGGHHHNGAHMTMTLMRPSSPGDAQRAQQVVHSLRTALERYKDYHAALADGYKPFLPNLPQKEYHFTKYWSGFLEAFTFDPARPTSLLYKKTSGGYELSGAMFTMPKNATEDQLDARVPLSVASWHLHTNLCMPPKGQEESSDWTKFGLRGSIVTPESCRDAGGRFFPSIFGWMVHVYPFEDSPGKIFGQM
ncbi:MAG TPA: hypothetical protein VOA41_15695 [Candidatus Dormibacteraeota bacterium]|nr:hypothetical protein [Candidatus Dormibacteraeota bacterium]